MEERWKRDGREIKGCESPIKQEDTDKLSVPQNKEFIKMIQNFGYNF